MPGEADTLARLDRLNDGTVVGAWEGQSLAALARVEDGCLRPIRVINR